MFWGKLFGILFGYFLFHGGILGLFGALLGGIVGHLFDRVLNVELGGSKVRDVFFRTTFLVMGHIAKSDGRVSERELASALQIMGAMNLAEAERLRAMALFTQGKTKGFDLQATLSEFKSYCRDPQTRLFFLQIQIKAAHADGLHPAELRILEYIAQTLQLGPINFQSEAGVGAGQSHRYRQPPPGGVTGPSLKDAYRLLDVDESATDAMVKRAYRRKMSANHPDRLIAKGVPEEMIKLATEKTQAIKAAYEQICRARGLK